MTGFDGKTCPNQRFFPVIWRALSFFSEQYRQRLLLYNGSEGLQLRLVSSERMDLKFTRQMIMCDWSPPPFRHVFLEWSSAGSFPHIIPQTDVQSLRETGREIYPSWNGKNLWFGRVFPSKPGFFPSQISSPSHFRSGMMGRGILYILFYCHTGSPEGLDLKFTRHMTWKTRHLRLCYYHLKYGFFSFWQKQMSSPSGDGFYYSSNHGKHPSFGGIFPSQT